MSTVSWRDSSAKAEKRLGDLGWRRSNKVADIYLLLKAKALFFGAACFLWTDVTSFHKNMPGMVSKFPEVGLFIF